MKKEDLLKIFDKYGYHSYKKEPFFYEGKEGNGIVFSVKHPFFGNLTRIYLPGNTEEAEKFLSTYYDYKKKKKNIQIELKEYKSKFPDIMITEDDSIEELKVDEFFVSEQNYMKRLKRTYCLLLKVIENKIEVQNATYHNLVQLTNEYMDKQNEWNKKMGEIEKKTYPLIEPQLEKIKESYSLGEEDKLLLETQDRHLLEDRIHTLVEDIKKLELDEGLLKNKYEMIKLPLQIKLIKDKLEILSQPIYKKKGFFGKKEKFRQALQDLENQSTLQNIVSYPIYEENEKKRIEEKYAMIADLDIRTIADYLIEFDNLKIEEPHIEEQTMSYEKQEFTFEDSMKYLEEEFQKRSKKEQDQFVEFAYLTKNILNQANPLQAVEIFRNRMQNPNNIMIQVKYFKNIDFSTNEKCLESIKKLFNQTLKLDAMKILKDIHVFFKDNKRMTSSLILKTSTKRLLAPFQEKGENDCTYIATLKKDALVYFVPEEIVEDINEENLYLKKDTPYLFINLSQHILNFTDESFQKVVDYEPKKKTENQLTTVHELKSCKVNLYQFLTIERKKI